MKIFWSWQSDTHQPSNRHFVRDVLADLARNLNGVDVTEDAERPDIDEDDDERDFLADDGRIEVDHDTLGVGGSPPIADTILRKIREAAVFVADVTPICITAAGKRVPNPNVMIELGYAMKVLDYQRIVLVMNAAEGAALKYLPFDLRHWRAPAIYSLRKDASDERRAEVAAGLKATLKKRITPGLKLAEETSLEDRRRSHRAPELTVIFDGEVSGPHKISQIIGSLGAKTLDEIRTETPLLPLPRARDAGLVSGALSQARHASAFFDSDRKKPIAQWTREETEGYNSFVSRYHSDYERYLVRLVEFTLLKFRSFEVKLALDNSGTLPATAIDVDVTFPPCIILYDDKKFALEPAAPDPPPLRPIRPGTGIVSRIEPPFDLLSPSLYAPKSTYFYPSERRVHFSLDELKHNHMASFAAFIVSFATVDDIASFEAEYVITANEPIDPIKGVVRFEIQRDDG